MFSSIQNVKFIILMKPLDAYFWFFGLLRSKFKIENNYFFTKNFARYLVLFCKMMNQNPNFFEKKWKLNTPLRPTSKIENNHLFTKKVYIVFYFIM